MRGLYKQLRGFGRPVAVSVTCFLVAGPIVLIIGAALLVWRGTDTRSSSISAYNDAVSTWRSSASSFLLNASTSGWFAVQAHMGRVLALSDGGDADYPAVETGGDISNYSTHSTVTGNELGSSPFQQLQWTDTSLRIRTANVQVIYQAGNSPTVMLTLPALPVWEYTEQVYTGISSCSSSQQSHCPLSGGYWSCSIDTGVGNCSQWWALSSLCVVMDPRTGLFDASAGCVVPDSGFASQYLPSAGRPTSGVPMAQAGYDLYTAQPAGIALPTWSLNLRVRSSQDPWLVAMRLTSGSGSFGLSTGQTAGTGIALLAVGSAVTVLACIATYALLRCCEHRRFSKWDGDDSTTVVMISPAAGTGSVVMPMPMPQPGTVGHPLPTTVPVPLPMQPHYAPLQPQYAPPQYAPQQANGY